MFGGFRFLVQYEFVHHEILVFVLDVLEMKKKIEKFRLLNFEEKKKLNVNLFEDLEYNK
jgi:hypothetical protein